MRSAPRLHALPPPAPRGRGRFGMSRPRSDGPYSGTAQSLDQRGEGPRQPVGVVEVTPRSGPEDSRANRKLSAAALSTRMRNKDVAKLSLHRC